MDYTTDTVPPDYTPQQGDTLTDPTTGTTWSYDQSGNAYISGMTDVNANTYNAPSAGMIPNTGAGGTGPGGAPGDTTFSLGTVAQGVGQGAAALNAAANAVSAAANATVTAVRNAKTAVVAVNTPSATAQWLAMPLQQQIFLGVAVFAVLWMVFKHKV